MESDAQEIIALEASLDVSANAVGSGQGGQVYLQTRVVDDRADLEAAYQSFSRDDAVRTVISLLPSRFGPHVTHLARDYRLLTISTVGSEWWEMARGMENVWHYGLTASTVGIYAALLQMMDPEGLSCIAIGVVLNGTQEERQSDVLAFEQLSEGTSVSWHGATYVDEVDSAQAAIEAWDQVPDCILAERGTHQETATMAKLLAAQAPDVRVIFASLRGVEEFVEEPDLVTVLTNNYRLNATNGPRQLKNLRHFELVLQRTVPGGRRPFWYEHTQADATVMMGMVTVLVANREASVPIFLEVSSPNTPAASPAAYVNLPNVFQTIFNTDDTDYRGVAGDVDFVEGRPLAFQRYQLDRIDNFIEQSFDRVARVLGADEGQEYELAN